MRRPAPLVVSLLLAAGLVVFNGAFTAIALNASLIPSGNLVAPCDPAYGDCNYTGPTDPPPDPTDPPFVDPSVDPSEVPTDAPTDAPTDDATPSDDPVPTDDATPTDDPSPEPTDELPVEPTEELPVDVFADPTLDITEELPIPEVYGDFVPDVEVVEPDLRELERKVPHFDAFLQGALGYSIGDAVMAIDAFGLLPGTRVNIEMHSAPVPLGSALVSASGAAILSARMPTIVPAGTHVIYVRAAARPGSGLPERLERIATVIVGEDGTILGIEQDLRAVPEAGSDPVLPKEPVPGRGNTTIVTAQEGTLVYLSKRVSTNPIAAAIPKASDALAAPGTYSGGLVTVLLLAIIGIALEFPFNWIQERAKGYYLALMSRLRGGDGTTSVPRVLGVRVDVIAFLFVGQIIAALNAPLEALPPMGQVAQSAVFGAIAVFAISGWYALPQMLLHRRHDGDIGNFHAEWPSLLVASVALVAAQLSGIVPGFLIGLFTVRRFRTILPDAQTARGAWTSTVLLVAFAVVAWFFMDIVDGAIADAMNPLRIVVDGVFGVILVAGTQGALLNLLDPGDDFAMALRRSSMPLWLSAIALAGGVSFAFLASGDLDIALFAPPASAGEFAALLGFAVVSLAAIALLHRAAQRLQRPRRRVRAA